MLNVAVSVLLTGVGFQSGSWTFNPLPDTFSANAELDLRNLNEKIAGEHGYIRVNSDGDFEREDGKPIRFWAVNTNVARDKPFVPRPRWSQKEPILEVHARFLAKRGVNLVRMHAQIAPSEKQSITDVNMGDIDWIWRSVAAMKKEGIYSVVSPYWMVPTKIPESWGVAGGAQGADGLLFFDPTLQKAYKGWLKKLLSEKNPYTGIPLAKDPALAILSIQNEDSLLFWTVNGIKGLQKLRLGQKFFEFGVKKYGSSDAMFRAWGNTRLPADSFGPDVTGAKGSLDFYNIWEMTQKRTGGMHVRLSDQLEFWSRTMFDWNAEVKRFVREELGCKALLNAGNWKTADSSRLNDAERWSYTACEVDAVNHYIGGIHKGPNEGWSINKGDVYTSPSAILDPKTIPVNLKQTAGRPIMVTESMWVMPNANGVEAPFLISAASSINGVDAYFWFSTGDEQWTPPQSANGYADGQQKWMFGSPDVLGMFPAAALTYRLGLVKRPQPVVIERRTLPDIFERRIPLITEEGSFDPNRDSGDFAPASNVKTSLRPEVFLTGPVVAELGARTSISDVPKISIDPKHPRTADGQFEVNVVGAHSRLVTEKAVGVAFARPQSVDLGSSRLSTQNAHGSLMIVALDDQSIEKSNRVLVQYGTRARPTGWKERPTEIKLENQTVVPGFEILDTGKSPWKLETPQAVISIQNSKLRNMKVLNENFERVRIETLIPANGKVNFQFPSGALYVVLESN